MHPLRARASFLLGLVVATLLLPLASGCGGESTKSGPQATPVDVQEAATQNKAYENFRESKKAGN
jgi:hypothetical protein